MVQLIVGKKGKGKTKQLLDKVNAEINGSPYAFWDTSARQEPASSVVPVFPPSTVTFSGAFFSPVRYLSVELK